MDFRRGAQAAAVKLRERVEAARERRLKASAAATICGRAVAADVRAVEVLVAVAAGQVQARGNKE